MLSRRELITAGVAGSLASSPAPEAATTALQSQEPTREGQREVARAVGDVEEALRQGLMGPSLSAGQVGKLRALMEQFLRSHGKFPDYFEVGSNVCFELYDWHVRHRQQLVVTRQPDNRYMLQFMFSQIILRPEQEANYIGYPYDKG
jgi:hypothetical protein